MERGMGAGGWVVLGVGLMTLGCAGAFRELPIDAADHAVMFTAADAAPLVPGFTPDPALEFWTKTCFAGEWLVNYGYTSAPGDPVLEIRQNLKVFPTVERARDDYAVGLAGVAVVQGLGYIATAPEEGLLGWGDEHVCHAVLDRDGTRAPAAGAWCAARLGRLFVTFEIRGIPLADPGAMDRLLSSQLTALEAYDLASCP